ncbi:hypothetical protein J0656_18140 [Muricauda ruestringensis]|uniref:Outer membrane protein beta-barrel domain-containing protein n=1 Tax=Flagellimonas aurea TaxID=2915619 RepID=A0ABS3GAB9_9FLAO|nr:hypothetical protein [Allomuricauda aurea]MAO17752.1 hypothetical protein [Allomuricauda sp.]MBO0355944.1 hypothetical protein [Allomuricauda aurea]|tara:strand:+ start:649 stop:1110 length:462 start_codon:yes stop_codon:yes gene_type:complete
MKKLLFVIAIVMLGNLAAKAQTSYKAALGLGIDLYDEATFFGATGKYFFSDRHVGQADLGFEDNATMATFLYSYHKGFYGAPGLRWYAGVGPSIIFIKDFDNIFALRPHLGLDFKIDGVPFVLNFDWRPSVVLSDVGDNQVAAFGFGLQFAIN